LIIVYYYLIEDATSRGNSSLFLDS